MMVFQFIGIQIFSIMYLALIFAIYSSKKRYVSVENDIFRVLLFFTLFQLVVDIAVNYSIKYAELMPTLNSILCKLSLMGYQVWSWLLMVYVLLLGNNKNYKNLKYLYKNSKKIKLWTLVMISLTSVLIFLPLDYLYDPIYKISYVVGPCTLYTYGVGLIYLLIILFSVIFNKYKISFLKRIPIFVFIITASIFLPIQRFNTDVPVLIVPLMAFAVMIMYFTLENPDIKLINELNNLKSEAEESNRIKTEFLANVSEDIRRPMNSIIGFSETLLNENLSAAAKSDAEAINFASNSLLEMINNILDISKIESGAINVENNEYNLKNILDKLNDFATNNNTANVSFTIKVDKKIPYKLIGDDGKIFRVLSNLISNALKYTEVGRITLKIDGNVVNEYLELKIKLSDTGIGIKETDYDKVFQKFSRVDNKLTRNVEGTGLGLAMSKQMINLMGGTIKFDSVYGGGTNFYIKLKQKIKDYEEIGDYIIKQEKKEKNIIFDCSTKKVLIIDDNRLNVRVIERMLEPYKVKAQSVLSGNECIDLLKSGNNYDLILLESKISDSNNIRMISVLKELNLGNSTKLIALTTDNFSSTKNKLIEEGFDNYLIKPIDIIKLNEIIELYLKK